jgi:hypothetical protein
MKTIPLAAAGLRARQRLASSYGQFPLPDSLANLSLPPQSDLNPSITAVLTQ